MSKLLGPAWAATRGRAGVVGAQTCCHFRRCADARLPQEAQRPPLQVGELVRPKTILHVLGDAHRCLAHERSKHVRLRGMTHFPPASVVSCKYVALRRAETGMSARREARSILDVSSSLCNAAIAPFRPALRVRPGGALARRPDRGEIGRAHV